MKSKLIIIRQIFLLCISFIVISCNLTKNNYQGISINEEMPHEIIERLINLKLINKSDTVLGLFYGITNEPNCVSESYTFFTSKKILRYYQFGKKEPKITETLISKTLNIRKENDPIDTNKIIIKVKKLKNILFSKIEQRDVLFSDDLDFRTYSGTSKVKQEQFYVLLTEVWKSNSNYNTLTQTNLKFFNDDGSKIITHDIIANREKLHSLKNKLNNINIEVIDKEDYLVLKYKNSIILMSYYFYSNKFNVLKLIVDPIPKDTMDMVIIAVSYRVHKHKEKKFPYTERGITYKDVKFSYEKTEKELIQKYFAK